MSTLKWTIIAALAAGALFAGFAGAFVAGYATAHPNFELRRFAAGAVRRVASGPRDAEQSAVAHAIFPSSLLTLRGDVLPVPADPRRPGGGLTSFGRDVLLLTAEGKLFKATPEGDLVELAVGIPDNGYEAYARLADSAEHGHLIFHLAHPRHNDILHYHSEIGRGLVISYTEYFSDAECYGTTVAALELDAGLPSAADIAAGADDWRILFRTDPCLPLKEDYYALEGDLAGGRMVFVAPSTLYLSSGDYRWDGMLTPLAVAQKPEWDYGKVIEIDIATGAIRTFSQGHRNPQGIALDRNGEIWVVEHGPRGGDELNRVVEGADYGWPSETLGTMYSGLPVPHTLSFARHDVFTAPVFAWVPSVAPSSLELIDGFHSAWDGDLLMGTLRNQHLHRLRIHDDRVQYAEPIDVGRRIRDVLQHGDGRLVLWTDSMELVSLSVEEHGPELRYLEERVLTQYDEEMRTTVRHALEGCMQCHALAPDMHDRAPSLSALYGARIARTSFSAYSDVLRAREGRWTRDALIAYLSDPQEFAPGTTMPAAGFTDAAVLDALVDVLAALAEPTDPR